MGGGSGTGAKQDGQQQEIITKFKTAPTRRRPCKYGEDVRGGDEEEANIMWQDLLIYFRVTHAVNYMHVLLSCTKECVCHHLPSCYTALPLPEHAPSACFLGVLYNYKVECLQV